ncbi:MAG: LuxR C-terminal-related transcriptional regulator [Hydrogenophaga sp.]|uniref:helix-turn-helix transcriptional regulator n=1 Tax=Hydrogenophaga sp. TaxID=1904254 RepID=UPI002AB814CD|nr:LuxR C-terminal-related transcriptional regulator [Hydrogenophaga sp.]MDZ4100479.1 LuxR C-terminal-related transcriptional regulator [Hydrogenophaga sp.]
MQIKAQTHEAFVEKALLDLMIRVRNMEEALTELVQQRTAPPVVDPTLPGKLEKLTLKRLAVLSGTLGGLNYQQLATLMDCSDTTVKLHLKEALQVLGIPNRAMLLVQHKHLLDALPDQDFESKYGINKRWWLDQPPELMAFLRTTKPGKNQHTP